VFLAKQIIGCRFMPMRVYPVLLLPFFVSCSNSTEWRSATVTVVISTVRTVVVAPSSVNLKNGLTAQFTATVLDSTGKVLVNWPVEWTGSNANLGTINANGLFTALAIGTDTVTAKSLQGPQGRAIVTVVP
jgi:hypothetical protein